MRHAPTLLAIVGLAAAASAADVRSAAAACSVFSRHPCHPTFCGIFHRGPCIPEIEYPIGQDLRLTIESLAEDDAPKQPDGSAAKNTAASPDDGDGGTPAGATPTEHKLDTIMAMYGALR